MRGLRLQGRRYHTEAYEAGRLVWPLLQMGPHQGTVLKDHREMRWCAEEHETTAHRCPVEGFQARKSHWRRHIVANCGKCRGPHLAQANACQKKKAARSDTKGWRLPSPTWRQGGKPSS